MDIKKIYLVRHGQTDYNLKRIVQGSGIDASLNETGRQQASLFFEKYQNHPFERVFTSSLKRSIESMDGFLKKGLPHTILPGLNEINWGTREGMRITPEEDAYYRMVLRSWAQGKTDLKIEGGESPEDVAARQRPALDQIIQSPEKEILICMHGRAMRVLLCLMLNYPFRCMDLFHHHNLCLYRLTYTGTMFTVDSFCDITHLER